MVRSRVAAPPFPQSPSIEEQQRQRQAEENQKAIALLRSWYEVDDDEAAEQRETLTLLIEALDEDRLPGQKLFK